MAAGSRGDRKNRTARAPTGGGRRLSPRTERPPAHGERLAQPNAGGIGPSCCERAGGEAEGGEGDADDEELRGGEGADVGGERRSRGSRNAQRVEDEHAVQREHRSGGGDRGKRS